MKTLVMAVDGMSCQNCVRHVTEALEELTGVDSVSVSLEENHATVSAADDFDAQMAARALDEAGYTMGEVQTG